MRADDIVPIHGNPDRDHVGMSQQAVLVVLALASPESVEWKSEQPV